MGVPENHTSISGYGAQDAYGTPFPICKGGEEFFVFGSDEEGIVLLVFCTPDFQDRKGAVAHIDLAHVIFRPRGLHDLLEHVTVPPRTLIVHAHDGIFSSQVTASPHEADHSVLHLGVAALHGVKIQTSMLCSLDAAGSCPPTDANAIGRAPNLDHQHSRFRCALDSVSSIHVTHARRKHDGLNPFHPSSMGQALSEGTGESMNYWFAKFVAIIAGPVRGGHQNVQGSCQIWRVNLCLSHLFPWQVVSGQVEVAHAVGRNTSDGSGPLSRGRYVTETSTRARLCSWKGRHTTGKIVRLCSEDGMQCGHLHLGGGGTRRITRTETLHLISSDGRRIVMEGDDRIVGDVRRQRVLHHLKEGVGLLYTVDYHLAAEKPMPAVFRIRLAHIKAFHVARITA
mmetsp:Transcript_5989/g.12794  ORF Transcript_5989/g.12794 Transcript_5989/m.12794 type:complete len:397 (-) Transcript_5989:769-1959(-)